MKLILSELRVELLIFSLITNEWIYAGVSQVCFVLALTL